MQNTPFDLNMYRNLDNEEAVMGPAPGVTREARLTRAARVGRAPEAGEAGEARQV
jgi:hypothetical protein